MALWNRTLIWYLDRYLLLAVIVCGLILLAPLSLYLVLQLLFGFDGYWFLLAVVVVTCVICLSYCSYRRRRILNPSTGPESDHTIDPSAPSQEQSHNI